MPVACLLATVSVEPYDDLFPAIIPAHASIKLAVNILAKQVDQPITDGTDTV